MKKGGPGGKREGAGRKKGARNKRTQATIDKAQAGGAMPLEIILKQMRRYDAAAEKLLRGGIASDAQVRELEALAAERARDAAPYLHPRLQSTTHQIKPFDLSKLTDEELEFLERLKQRAGSDIA